MVLKPENLVYEKSDFHINWKGYIIHVDLFWEAML